MTIIIFLIVLAVLIFIHELGHFLAARACNIKVEVFALGFGPRIISWKRKETEYALNLIPFGGYVKIFGENPDHASLYGPNAERSFINKNRFQQAIVLIAGVFFNFVLALLLYIGVFAFGVTAPVDSFPQYSERYQNERVMIVRLAPDSPAKAAGLKIGDVFYKADTVEDVQNSIHTSKGNPITLEVIRQSEQKNIEVTPIVGIVPDKYAIGIELSKVGDFHLPFFAAILEGWKYTIEITKLTLFGLGDFFLDILKGQPNFDSVGGPVAIAGSVGDSVAVGFSSLVILTALISINLGIINLVPFPALDGGRLLFVLIESIIRRRIPMKFANAVNMVGFTLLMVLMVVITYRDVLKLVG